MPCPTQARTTLSYYATFSNTKTNFVTIFDLMKVMGTPLETELRRFLNSEVTPINKLFTIFYEVNCICQTMQSNNLQNLLVILSAHLKGYILESNWINKPRISNCKVVSKICQAHFRNPSSSYFHNVASYIMVQ